VTPCDTATTEHGITGVRTFLQLHEWEGRRKSIVLQGRGTLAASPRLWEWRACTLLHMASWLWEVHSGQSTQGSPLRAVHSGSPLRAVHSGQSTQGSPLRAVHSGQVHSGQSTQGSPLRAVHSGQSSAGGRKQASERRRRKHEKRAFKVKPALGSSPARLALPAPGPASARTGAGVRAQAQQCRMRMRSGADVAQGL